VVGPLQNLSYQPSPGLRRSKVGFVVDMVEMKNKTDKYMIKINDDSKKEQIKMISSSLV
jgi:nicotinic acid phosphoribosyltransferase